MSVDKGKYKDSTEGFPEISYGYRKRNVRSRGPANPPQDQILKVYTTTTRSTDPNKCSPTEAILLL